MVDILVIIVLCSTVLNIIDTIFRFEYKSDIKYEKKICDLETAVQKLAKEIKEMKGKT